LSPSTTSRLAAAPPHPLADPPSPSLPRPSLSLALLLLVSQAKFAGENFTRHSGSTQDLNKLQLFAWQSESRGHDVHLQSNPTAAALAHKEFLEKKDVLKETSAASILDRYGGEQYLQAAPRELRAGQDEGYVEYDRRGKVVKGMERAKAKSKYDEDGASLARALLPLVVVFRRRRRARC